MGANNELSVDDVHQSAQVIKEASVLVFQFETPLETTVEALKLHKQGNGKSNFYIIFP